MFTCTRRFSMKVKEKIDFRVQLHATQVPAWDKLVVSLIPLDTGRVTCKTRKVPVRNGQCHWLDAVTETARLFLDIRTLQHDEKLYKFVVAKGLSRSGILGEVIINLAEYVSAASPTSITLPLRFCYAGTVLHVTIQCLTPRNQSRVDWQRSISKREELISDDDSEFSPFSNSFQTERASIEKYKRPKHSRSSTPETDGFQPLSPTSTASTRSFQTEKRTSTFAPISYVSLSSPTLERPQKEKSIESDLESTLLKLHDEAVTWKNMAETVQKENKMQKEELEKIKLEKMSLVAERESLTIKLEGHELKQELAFERDANCSLNLQLQKLQESNMELLLAVRELEDGQMKGTEDNRSAIDEHTDSTEKRIDRIIDLHREEAGDKSGMEQLTQVLLSGLFEDMKNVKTVLNELVRHLDTGGSQGTTDQLRFYLDALIRGSQNLIEHLHEEENLGMECSTLEGTAQREGLVLVGQELMRIVETMGEVVEDNVIEREKVVGIMKDIAGIEKFLQTDAVEADDGVQQKSFLINEKDSKILQLEFENAELELRLKSYASTEEQRKMKMDQLEVQVWEFAKELDYMQTSNESLEAMLVALKGEKQELELIVQNGGAKTELHLVEELEAQAKAREEEIDAYLLERCVFENLARDLCEQVQGVLERTNNNGQQDCRKASKQDFICQVKELRTSFSSLLKAREETEERFRGLEQTCDLLQARTMKQHAQLMTTIASLDAEFGQLSKESDQMLNVLNQEVSSLISWVEQDQKEKKTQDFLRVAAEENACEIAYLRNELQKLKAEKEALSRHSSEFEVEEKSDALRRLEAERLECRARLQVLAGECEAAKLQELETSERLDTVTNALQLQAERGELMKDQMHMLGNDIKCLEAEAKNLKAENGQLNISLLKLQNEHAKVQEERDAAQRKLFDLEALLKKCDMIRAAFEEQLHAEGCKVTFLESTLAQTTSLLELELVTVKSETQSNLHLLAAEFQALQEEHELSEKTYRQAKADLEHCELLKGAMENKLACCQTELQSERSAEAVLREECVGLNQEMANLKQQMEEHEKQEVALEQEVLRLKGVQESHMYKITSLETELQSERAARDNCSVLRKDYERQITVMQIKLDELDLSKQTFHAEVRHLKTVLEDCSCLKDKAEADLTSMLEDCRQENLDLKRQVNESSSAKSEMESRHAHLHKSMDIGLTSLAQSLDAKERLLLEILQRFEAEYKRDFEAFEAQLTQCHCANVSLGNQFELGMQTKESEATTVCLELKEKNEELALKVADCEISIMSFQLLQDEVQSCQEIISVMESDVYTKSLELDLLRRQDTLPDDAELSAAVEALERDTNLELSTLEKGITVTSTPDVRRKASTLKTKEPSCGSGKDIKSLHRKWKQPEGQMIELQTKLTALEAEHASKCVQLSKLLDKSRESEAILCEKILYLELSRRTPEVQSALKETEHLKHVRTTLEESLRRLKASVEEEKALHAEKTAECGLLKQENRELKQEVEKLTTANELEQLQRMEATLDSTRGEFQEREALLWRKIECLEIANEQLATQQVDVGTEQLKKELTRLQSQNSDLSRRQQELLSKLSTHELLQQELQRLQEANEQLEQKLTKLKEDSLWDDTLERLMYLETELAEAVETNNMYKLQLQSIFSKQQNVQTAALHNLGDVEEVINSLVSFKKQIIYLEAELKEMQDRYLGMSLRFAEMQSEREELIMTLKTLRSEKKG